MYGKGVSKLERLIISVSKYTKFNLIRQRGSIGKVYNIIKYIIQLIGRYKDFTKNWLKAYIEDELFNYEEFLIIKDRGIQWNLTYFILRYILLLYKVINRYLLTQRKLANNSYNLLQDALTNNNQQQIERLIKILKPFI